MEMARVSAFALLIAAMSMPASAVTVEAANGDWSKLPQLNQRGYNHLNEKMQAKLFEIAESANCPSFALNQGRLNFSVTFATQYSPDGTLNRLILPKLDCAEAESVVGGALLEMLQAGDYAPTGKSAAGWYKGGLEFSFAGGAARDPAVAKPVQEAAASDSRAADPNQILCEKVTEIGSRLSTKRVCMSRAQWAERRRLDREEVEKAQQTRCQEADHSC
jgi:hypothetical protein